MAGCRDHLAFVWGGGEPHQDLVPVIGEGGMETIGGHQTRAGSIYHGCCCFGGCNSKPYWFLLPSLCLSRLLPRILCLFLCVGVGHGSVS